MMPERSRGFTLVEVMVALAIVALTLPALLFSLDQQIDGTAYLRQRTLAQWVAANRIAELRLNNARTGTVATGRSNGESELADQTWYWQLDAQETQIPGFFRVEIRVSDREDEQAEFLATVNAYLASEQTLVRQ
ncbi:MAG: type II secretion system minor pseudopilin GspI [Halieaceae bacterium]|jgi:general secretion pathway protein I|nr:type II secretion system minor pseudopilin GspI [Halieaceae bacterium]